MSAIAVVTTVTRSCSHTLRQQPQRPLYLHHLCHPRQQPTTATLRYQQQHLQPQHQRYAKAVGRRRSAISSSIDPIRMDTRFHPFFKNASHNNYKTGFSSSTWRFLSIAPTQHGDDNDDDDNNKKEQQQLKLQQLQRQHRPNLSSQRGNVTALRSSWRIAADDYSREMILFKYSPLSHSLLQHQQEHQRCSFSSSARDSSDTNKNETANNNNSNNNSNNNNADATASSDTASSSSSSSSSSSTSGRKKMSKKQYQQRMFRKRDVNNPEYLRQRQERMDIVMTSFRNNTIISVIKLMAWLASGSSSMLAELIHSLVDSFNQGLLLVGHHYSGSVADRQHPYGYGKSVYFWSLVSALGTFFGGAGLSFMHSYHELMHPSLQTITWHVWGVLAISFLLDGQVLVKASRKFLKDKKKGDSVWSHLQKTRDPFNLAMLLEDGAACTGVIIAIAGIWLSHTYQNPIYDGLGGIGISALLGAVGIILAGFNHRFLLGQAVDQEMVKGIHDIIMKRRSIDGIRSVQTQWIGPDSFSYKAEVDFDGTYIAAKLLPSYLDEFSKAKLEIEHELRVLLSFYTEDVLRMVEQEVRSIEAEIRLAYPGAEYIELEPMSKDLDEMMYESKTAELRKIELEALRSHEASLLDDDAMFISDAENEYMSYSNTTNSGSSTTTNTSSSSSSSSSPTSTTNATKTTSTTYWDDTKF